MAELSDRVSVGKRQFWREFLALYERLPELWDARNSGYRHRDSKYEAYDVLERKLREIEPSATRSDVQRRINIFRTNYRRERLRILKQKELGLHPDICKPTLWFYDYMSFLLTQETFQHGSRSRKARSGQRDKVKLEEGNSIQDKIPRLDIGNNWTAEDNPLQSKADPALPQLDESSLLSPKIEIFEHELDMMEAEPTMQTPDELKQDAADTSASDYNEPNCSTTLVRGVNTAPPLSEASEVLAKSWAIQYEEMAPTQRILARKAIADILFEGCMGNLRINRGERSSVGNQL